MKIYVVTSGYYSDYRIQRVFTDKKLAQKYISMFNGYDEAEIEEYETEENDFHEITYIDVNYNAGGNYNFKIRKSNTLDNNELDVNFTQYYDWENGTIILRRVINNLNYNEECLKEKYLKVCHDLSAQIKHMKLEGATQKDIQQWLSGKKTV